MKTTSPLRLIALTGFSFSAFILLAGCSESSSSSDTGAAQSQADDHGDDVSSDSSTQSSSDIYPDILGEITALPVTDNPNSDLKIHHMQIPNFKTKDGIVNVNAQGISGMRSMTMPFPRAEGLSLDGLAIGDKIKFTFAVDWSGNSANAWEVTKIEKISADTVIDFTNKIEGMEDAAEDAMDDAMENMPDMPEHDAP